MLKLEQPLQLDSTQFNKFIEFIEAFLSESEEEMTVKDVIDKITSCDPKKSGVWFIYEDDCFKGYVFIEIIESVDGTIAAIQQLSMQGVKDKQVYTQICDKARELGKPYNIKELICSTIHNPKAFARLIKNGFKLETHILSAPV